MGLLIRIVLLAVAVEDLPETQPATSPTPSAVYLFEPGKSFYHRPSCPFIREVPTAEPATQTHLDEGALRPCPVCCVDKIARRKQAAPASQPVRESTSEPPSATPPRDQPIVKAWRAPRGSSAGDRRLAANPYVRSRAPIDRWAGATNAGRTSRPIGRVRQGYSGWSFQVGPTGGSSPISRGYGREYGPGYAQGYGPGYGPGYPSAFRGRRFAATVRSLDLVRDP